MKPTVLAGALLNDVGPIIGGAAFSDIVDYMGADRVHDNIEMAITYLKTQFPDLPANDEATWTTLVENVMCQSEDGRLRPDWDPNIAAPLQNKKETMIPKLWPLFRALGGRPILALRGGRSKLLSRETFSDMEHFINGIRCITIADAGHPVDLMHPDVLVEIDTWLEKT